MIKIIDDELYRPLEKCFLPHPITDELKQNIDVSRKNNMFLYNYNNRHVVPRNDPILMRCRGLVLTERGRILNYPFIRFFNDFEKEAGFIDWATSSAQEKIDGSFISVFKNMNDEWEITTRGSFYPTRQKESVDFAELFKKHFHQFDALNPQYCYMFELVTNENRIVKFYAKEFVVLTGARNLCSLNEISQNELDRIATQIHVCRPRRFCASNITECKKLFEKFADDDEGLVIVDKHFNRLKIKQQTYFQLSRIKMLSNQDILDYIRGYAEVDSELLYRDLTIKQRINQIKREYIHFINIVRQTFQEINQQSTTRKNFALQAIVYSYKSLLFDLYDQKSFKTIPYALIKKVLKDDENAN